MLGETHKVCSFLGVKRDCAGPDKFLLPRWRRAIGLGEAAWLRGVGVREALDRRAMCGQEAVQGGAFTIERRTLILILNWLILTVGG